MFNVCLASYNILGLFICIVWRFLLVWDRIVKVWRGICYCSLTPKQGFKTLVYTKQDPVQERVF